MNKAHRKISPGSLYSMGGKKNRCMTSRSEEGYKGNELAGGAVGEAEDRL